MIIAGNFKANHTRSSALSYCQELDLFLQNKKEEVYIFPPNASLPYGDFSCLNIGAQNAYLTENGAFTGEIGLEQLQELKIKTIMIGHSERRAIFAESNDLCRAKFDFFAQKEMKIFFCVGENLAVRQEGKVGEFLQDQLAGIELSYSHLIIAYEPIWAIGTGVSAGLEEIGQTCEILKNLGCARVVYGGSVNANNAGEIMDLEGIDGVLVGGACLDLENFCQIIKEGEKSEMRKRSFIKQAVLGEKK